MIVSKNCFTIVPLEYDIFLGMDVDKKSVAITIVDHKREIRSIKMPNNAEMIINYTRNHFSDKRVVFVYESGPTGYGLYDQIKQAGYTCLVVAPSMVPTPPGRRVKTNRIDGRKLAISLRGGELTSIRVPSRKYRDLRHLTQLYKITSKQNSNYKCRIKALLLVEGIAYPNTSKYDHWSNNTICKLETLVCDPSIRFKLDTLLENLRFHRQQLLKVKKELRRFCMSDPDIADSIKFLLSLPGIGWIISTVLLARVGDWRNLKNVRELAGFIGLTPSENSTGDDVNKGNITRTGDSYLRNILVEGAWSTITKDPELAEFYQRIYDRHPKNIAARKAIIAVARKLTTRIFAVLTERRVYTLKNTRYNKANKKRKPNAPKDDSTLRRTAKYTLRKDKYFPVLTGSFREKETSGHFLCPKGRILK